jgi:mycothiol synthase
MGKIGGKGMNEPRPYRDGNDLMAMQQVLVDGRKADNGSYYIHIGDLRWWLYYPPLEGDFWDHIYLWDDPDHRGRLLGWALISPDWVGIDVYIQPGLRGSDHARDMYLWAEEQAAKVAREKKKKTIYILWIAHQDEVMDKHLITQGFQRKRGYVHFERNLEQELPIANLLQGFVVRACAGLPEVTARATAQAAAFESSVPFERYLDRFVHFMRSPVYDNELDIIAVDPLGQVGAFCIVWPDLVNKVGLFEPVGTHPGFQRKGLGRAVMLEGMQRLKMRGINTAIVSTFEENLPAIKLYKALGFTLVKRLGTYEKDV